MAEFVWRVYRGRTLYNDDGDIIRPYRPHTNLEPIQPGETYRYDVEVFPLGHLVHSDHRLVMSVYTPPLTDGLWGYEPSRAPGVNTVYRDPERPSSVLLPLGEWTDAEPPAPACGEPAGYRCLETRVAVLASGSRPWRRSVHPAWKYLRPARCPTINYGR